jgi:hypothetical protein
MRDESDRLRGQIKTEVGIVEDNVIVPQAVGLHKFDHGGPPKNFTLLANDVGVKAKPTFPSERFSLAG